MTILKKVRVANPQGLHARPASIFVKIANKFESEITVTKEDQTVNAKSIMGLLMLAAEQGSEIEIAATGKDAEKAIAELEAFLVSGAESDKPERPSGS